MPITVSLIVEILGAGLILAVLAWRAVAAGRAWRDARGRDWSPLASLGWAVGALVYPAAYWWQARLGRLAPAEAENLLQSAAKAHHLKSVASIRCPLCDAEIVNALTLTAAGALAIRPRSNCPRCDFRLDTCRHCQHFLPAQDGTGGQGDMTHGRCDAYRALQPVQEAYPNLAPRLLAMGYDSLNAPKAILDSYVPLDECTSFGLHRERLRRSRVGWLSRERTALLKLWQKQLFGRDSTASS